MSLKLSQKRLKSFFISYGTAILFVAAALLVTLAIWSIVKPLASPLFLVAAMLAARRVGLGGGVFATLLSGILIDYFFISPEYQLNGNVDDLIRLGFFTGEGFVLCWLITARTKAAEEIRKSREQLLAASLRQQTLVEEERKRIALEIHDELGQSLTGVKIETYQLKKQFAANQAHEFVHDAEKRVEEMLRQIDSTIVSVRRIATELRPAILDDLGVVAAIEWQTREFQKRTGITCKMSSNIEQIEAGSEFATAVFRIYQESLTNIARHAGAHSVTVHLTRDEKTLTLCVKDDGSGIKTADDTENGERKSFGIFGMRERARLIKGDLKVYKSETGGTTVLLTAPLSFGVNLTEEPGLTGNK